MRVAVTITKTLKAGEVSLFERGATITLFENPDPDNGTPFANITFGSRLAAFDGLSGLHAERIIDPANGAITETICFSLSHMQGDSSIASVTIWKTPTNNPTQIVMLRHLLGPSVHDVFRLEAGNTSDTRTIAVEIPESEWRHLTGMVFPRIATALRQREDDPLWSAEGSLHRPMADEFDSVAALLCERQFVFRPPPEISQVAI